MNAASKSCYSRSSFNLSSPRDVKLFLPAEFHYPGNWSTFISFLSILGANNGLSDLIALYLVDGYAKLVIDLGPHPMAPLELYMNKGDRLDDKTWHTVEVIRERKVRQ